MTTHIIAYVFEADIHCPVCTYKRFAPPWNMSVPDGSFTDEHGVPQRVVDREGNEPLRVRSNGEPERFYCGDCHKLIGG